MGVLGALVDVGDAGVLSATYIGDYVSLDDDVGVIK